MSDPREAEQLAAAERAHLALPDDSEGCPDHADSCDCSYWIGYDRREERE